jgi:hypothetical protein
MFFQSYGCQNNSSLSLYDILVNMRMASRTRERVKDKSKLNRILRTETND